MKILLTANIHWEGSGKSYQTYSSRNWKIPQTPKTVIRDTQFRLDNNTISNLKPALTELLLAFNRLTEIPTQVLNGMSRLQHLDLSKNRIRSVERLAFGKFDGTGTSLLKLNLAGNLIENITDPGAFLYMSSLAYLDLSYNRISHLTDTAFERLEGLQSLFLQVSSKFSSD